MNAEQLKGSWNRVKGKIRQKFGKLTDDDLEIVAGQRDVLIGKLQERYGYARERAEQEADSAIKSLH